MTAWFGERGVDRLRQWFHNLLKGHVMSTQRNKTQSEFMDECRKHFENADENREDFIKILANTMELVQQKPGKASLNFIKHCEAVEQTSLELLKKCSIDITETEKFVLLLAIWLHDIGLRDPTGDNEIPHLEHEERSAKWISESPELQANFKGSCFDRQGCRDFLLHTLAIIVSYHINTRPIEECPETRTARGFCIRSRLLAATLRLADSLHVDPDHFSSSGEEPSFLRLMTMDDRSSREWLKSKVIFSINLDEKMRVIEVTVDIPNEYGGESDSGAETDYKSRAWVEKRHDIRERVRIVIRGSILSAVNDVKGVFRSIVGSRFFDDVHVKVDECVGHMNRSIGDISRVLNEIDIVLSPNTARVQRNIEDGISHFALSIYEQNGSSTNADYFRQADGILSNLDKIHKHRPCHVGVKKIKDGFEKIYKYFKDMGNGDNRNKQEFGEALLTLVKFIKINSRTYIDSEYKNYHIRRDIIDLANEIKIAFCEIALARTLADFSAQPIESAGVKSDVNKVARVLLTEIEKLPDAAAALNASNWPAPQEDLIFELSGASELSGIKDVISGYNTKLREARKVNDQNCIDSGRAIKKLLRDLYSKASSDNSLYDLEHIFLLGFGETVLNFLSSSRHLNKEKVNVYVAECASKRVFSLDGGGAEYHDGVHFGTELSRRGFKRVSIIPDIELSTVLEVIRGSEKGKPIPKAVLLFGANGVSNNEWACGHTAGHLMMAQAAKGVIPVVVLASRFKIADTIKWDSTMKRKTPWLTGDPAVVRVLERESIRLLNYREDRIPPEVVNSIIYLDPPWFWNKLLATIKS